MAKNLKPLLPYISQKEQDDIETRVRAQIQTEESDNLSFIRENEVENTSAAIKVELPQSEDDESLIKEAMDQLDGKEQTVQTNIKTRGYYMKKIQDR